MVVKEVMKEMFSVIFGPKNIWGPNSKLNLLLRVSLQISLIFVMKQKHIGSTWIFSLIEKVFPGESIRYLGGIE